MRKNLPILFVVLLSCPQFCNASIFDHLLNVTVYESGHADQTTIAFGPSYPVNGTPAYTDTFDNGLDAYKLMSRNGVPTLYTLLDTIRLSVDALPDYDTSVTTVPMGLFPGANGVDTFRFTGLYTFDPTALIYLEDLQLHIIQLLQKDSVYICSVNMNDPHNRFIIHFVPAVAVNVIPDCHSPYSTMKVNMGLYNVDNTTVIWDHFQLAKQGVGILDTASHVDGLLVFDSLSAGIYTLTFTINGYVAVPPPDTIQAFAPLATTIHSSDITRCGGDCTGNAIVQAIGGIGSTYTYQWSTSPSQTTDSISGLCAGTYYVTVSDSLQCIGIDSVTITQPPPLVKSLRTYDAACDSICSGEIVVNVSGGTPRYTYTWSAPNHVNDTAINLCAGTYYVTVADNHNCIVMDSAVIHHYSRLSINLTSTNQTCGGVCTGSAAVHTSGGGPTLSYLWSNGATTDSVSGLCASLYGITVSDNTTCDVTDTVTLTSPPQLLAAVQSITNICDTGCSGLALVGASGGSGNYHYAWSTIPAQTTDSATHLCPGSYYVTVSDSNHCISIDTVTIFRFPGITNSIVFINNSCTNLCNGSAAIQPAGGTPPFYVVWADPLTAGDTVTGLCPGYHTFSINDNYGCGLNDSVFITNGRLRDSIVSLADRCGNTCNGSATINAYGGDAPYAYNWLNIPQDTTNTAIGLCVGTYTFSITDSIGCYFVDSITIGTGHLHDSILSITNSCNNICNGSAVVTATSGIGPYTYNWTTSSGNSSNLCAGTYTVSITDSEGCGTIDSVTIGSGRLNDSIVSLTNSCSNICNGNVVIAAYGGTLPYTYNWFAIPSHNGDSATNLCPGNYALSISDGIGCAIFDTFTIGQIAITDITGGIPTFCGLCSASVAIKGYNGTGPYIFAWSNGITADSLSNLCAATYMVTVTDQQGCTGHDSVVIGTSTAVTASFTPSDTIVHIGDTVNFTNTSITGLGPTYKWYFGNGDSLIGNTSPYYVYADSGTYSVKLIVIGATCSDTFSVNIKVTPHSVGIASVETSAIRIVGHEDIISLWLEGAGKYMGIIEVYDVLGKKVYAAPNISLSQNRHDIDLGNITTGCYFVRIISGNNISTAKVILGSFK